MDVRWRFKISMNLDESLSISGRPQLWTIASVCNQHRLSSIVFFISIGRPPWGCSKTKKGQLRNCPFHSDRILYSASLISFSSSHRPWALHQERETNRPGLFTCMLKVTVGWV